jgi:TRAP-type C4-dicarboxylate transport system permease small subunit
MARFLRLVLLPLAVLIGTVSVRPLMPLELRTAWPMLACVLMVSAFALVATTSYGWARSRITAAFVTTAAVGVTLIGLYALLLWALTSTWG